MIEKRIEQDFLGSLEIPADAYWGIHTQRAITNFPISSLKVNDALIKSLALTKKACCLASLETGHLTVEKGKAIIAACDEIAAGALSDQFPVDALQGGAGTSTNMNINEVIANRAIEFLGGQKGNYSLLHPLEDVNRHQSTNDVYPTALKVASIYRLRDLSNAITGLQGSFQEKEKEFAAIVKLGRTELQEAVPITLGAEFSAFAEAFSRDRWRTFKCEERLRVVNLGGTAVGTGLAAPRNYIFLVIEKLREVTGLGLSRGENILGETANSDSFVEVSGILKAHAVNLIKISNDLRLMNLLGEIHLPQLQAGSSIMPGKVNPVLTEAAIQTGIKVIANDGIITETAARGTLQINEFLPLLGHSMLESLDLLININRLLTLHVREIKACKDKCEEYFNASPMIITALLPVIGYEKATAFITEFSSGNENNMRLFLEKKLGKELIDQAFSPHQLTALGYKDDK
ncbi:MAG: aspartate ammonia-lyase [Deltaproteobacteria bacterium HGW-Deltaproteobacteria-12]|jgi:aspartate ammonia-lyase|nr:MAG: aspartate ammonia-lyase [Deltaproteobacteria bacterium HGW-Deltaproteobacteria-12]